MDRNLCLWGRHSRAQGLRRPDGGDEPRQIVAVVCWKRLPYSPG